MGVVIKVGGSLAANPIVLKALCKRLGRLAEKHRIVVVPGGGEFADLVRKLDGRYSISPVTAHKMAILGMEQYGFLLSELIPDSLLTQSVAEAVQVWKSKRIAIFLPSRIMFEEDPLEASWDVTSDSIAAYIASRLKARLLILVTDVDGLFKCNPKMHLKAELIRKIAGTELLKNDQRTCVDKFLAGFLLKSKLRCFVVNGSYPERVEKILANKTAICTQIVVK